MAQPAFVTTSNEPAPGDTIVETYNSVTDEKTQTAITRGWMAMTASNGVTLIVNAHGDGKGFTIRGQRDDLTDDDHVIVFAVTGRGKGAHLWYTDLDQGPAVGNPGGDTTIETFNAETDAETTATVTSGWTAMTLPNGVTLTVNAHADGTGFHLRGQRDDGQDADHALVYASIGSATGYLWYADLEDNA
jgi:hypothetical protein